LPLSNKCFPANVKLVAGLRFSVSRHEVKIWVSFAISLFAQPKESSCQNLQAIPVAELAKSFGRPNFVITESLGGFRYGAWCRLIYELWH